MTTTTVPSLKFFSHSLVRHGLIPKKPDKSFFLVSREVYRVVYFTVLLSSSSGAAKLMLPLRYKPEYWFTLGKIDGYVPLPSALSRMSSRASVVNLRGHKSLDRVLVSNHFVELIDRLTGLWMKGDRYSVGGELFSFNNITTFAPTAAKANLLAYDICELCDLQHVPCRAGKPIPLIDVDSDFVLKRNNGSNEVEEMVIDGILIEVLEPSEPRLLITSKESESQWKEMCGA